MCFSACRGRKKTRLFPTTGRSLSVIFSLRLFVVRRSCLANNFEKVVLAGLPRNAFWL